MLSELSSQCFRGEADMVLLTLRGHSSLLYRRQLILFYFSAKAKQATFLGEDWNCLFFCLFLPENLCKQQLLPPLASDDQ